MNLPIPDPTKKVLVHVTVDGMVEIHQYPGHMSDEDMWEIASDMLGTEKAYKHEFSTDYDHLVRARLYTMKQGDGLEHNKHLTDGVMEGLEVLTYIEGDAVLSLNPAFLEAP